MPMMLGQLLTGSRPFRTRFIVMTSLVGVAFLLLLGRLYHLQVLQGEEYNEKSIDNFVKETRIPADRGMILDNRGRILVDSRPSYNITLTPAFCQSSKAPKDYCLNEVIPKLATYLSLDADESSRVLDQYTRAKGLVRFRDFTVKADAQMDALDRVEANRIFDLPGIDSVAAPHRRYRYGTLAAHLLGYIAEIKPSERRDGYQLGDNIGRQGVELRFENELRGEDGILRTQVDAKGRKRHPVRQEVAGAEIRETSEGSDFLPKNVSRVTPATPGHNLVLSLSLPLQQAAEKAFESARAGSIVVVDVNTGFLLAVVSKPAYDPNKFRADFESLKADPLQPLIFRAAQQHYHPGSTFKAVTALAGLENGTITKSTNVLCNGGYSLGKRRWRCHKDSGHGSVDLHSAISWSCDTFFYQVADRMGIDPIAEMGMRFGLGKVSHLDLSPEVPGVMPSVEYHNRVTPGGYTKGLALNTAIGQGDTNLTPIQLAMTYAAIANGGTLYRPQLVRRIEDAQGRLVKVMEPIVVSKLDINPQHLAMVVEGLKAVVNEPGGTAFSKKPRDLDVVIAGKTGTAQVVAIGEKRLKEEQMDFFARDHAWFVGFAPANGTEIAIVVLSEHGGHGGAVSAPPAMDVIKAYFRIKAEEEAARNGTGAPPAKSPSPEKIERSGTAPPREALQKNRPKNSIAERGEKVTSAERTKWSRAGVEPEPDARETDARSKNDFENTSPNHGQLTKAAEVDKKEFTPWN